MSVGVQREATSRSGPRERAELVLAQLDQLPTLSPLVARLISLTGDNDASVRDLVRVIESDPSLTACILRLVRRADLGVRSDGMTIARAVPLLGFRLVRSAALSCPIFEALSGGDGSASVRRQDLWRHSLAVACACEMLAERTMKLAAAANAFVAGLLHDVGKIALDVCFPKSYARAWQLAAHDRLCMCDAEIEVLGLDHTVAGKRLATRWKFDAAIIDAIWLHHQDPASLPSSVAEPSLVRCVHLADGLVRRLGIGLSGSRHVVDLEEWGRPLQLDSAALEAVTASLPERVRALVESLGLADTEGDRSAWLESLEKAHRELGRFNARLTESNHALAQRCAVLDALSELNERLSEHDRVADACAVAADILRQHLGAQDALVAVGDTTAEVAHVGTSRASGDAGACVIDLSGSGLTAQSGMDAGFTPATQEHAEFWERCTGQAAASLWMAPIASDAFAGVALLAIDEGSLSHARPATDDLRRLLRAMSRAIASAWARNQSARTAEELIDLNRRLHAAQRELARRRSLAMIAQMAGGAAHELNNPLAVISGRAQMELATCTDAERKRSLDIIVEQAGRASNIVSELMRFAKPEDPQPAVLPLEGTLKTVCQHWAKSVGMDDRQLAFDVRSRATSAYCDGEHLREILEIVLTNAMQATDAASRAIKINLGPGTSDETVRIRVEDNGVGMALEVVEHAFDPFFSSRPAGRGRGLGLSRAYRLAEINGGRLWIESNPNKSTTVTIELPTRAPH